MINKIDWYNKIYRLYHNWYDIHKKYRTILMESINMKKGDVVIDLCCGNGKNFPFIVEKIGKEGLLIGIDGSENMLSIAKKNPNFANIQYYCIDLEKKSNLEKYKFEKVDIVICSFAISVLNNWEEIIDYFYNILNEGGKIAILDLYWENNNLHSKLVHFLVSANSTTPYWEKLRSISIDTTLSLYPFGNGFRFISILTKKS